MQAFIDTITQLCDEKKAEDICVYQLHDTTITDYIIITSVKNKIHAKSLLSGIEETMKPLMQTDQSGHYFDYPRTCGNADSGWIILDLNSIWVHILLDDLREYYALDAFLEKRGVVFHH